MAVDLDSIPFVKARWFTDTGSKGRKVDLIVIHDMEAAETDKTAENVARMFATTTRKASAHYNFDNNSVVCSVKPEDVAYHAPGANHNGIGLEHAGYASQRMEQWLDPFSLAMLTISAPVCAALCDRYGIPKTYVGPDGLRNGARGITTHDAASKAFGKSDHWDPGPNFPMDRYIAMVRGEESVVPPALPTPQGGGRVSINAPAVSVITHPTWRGYMIVSSDGGCFHFEAPNFGSLGNTPLNAPIVGGAPTKSGQGYWLVAADGGVFGFGDAVFKGSTGNIALNKPIVGIAPSDTGDGYGLIASDGGVFAFGDFEYFGGVEYVG